ncbi:uncharacterized protein CLUP02_15776 [Colletotrichum lupini]|uniref:Uncharacterized protein n=1 Tax=Colletotrichum lupini TaxID=145971 RepID=A0A9Q8WP16_9PEZI|nr:uncharacterized protein CLUP02_15776 [Colletotrichum lupini]KAK1714470.1 PLC-like phosphodiesterase [Colletotrichum lupini]UQC90246.1 hypothetical protein CLUP02_15776 [Colletotrichum lupini]
MGAGAYLQILNGTPYTFTNTAPGHDGYQMNKWDPGASISPGTTDFSYFEFKETIGVKESDTQVTSTYTVGDTGYSFSIRANDDPPRLLARIDGFSTPTMPEGEWLILGFVHNGSNPFVLIGTINNMLSSFSQPDWMHQNLATLGTLPLKQICMPGSHDAGMGVLNPDGLTQEGSAAVAGGIIQTQPTTIYQQLVNGSRYLDVRPVMAAEGDFRAGHFSSNSTIGEVGCYGQSMSDIVSDINKFTQQYAELIILDLSHGYDSTNDYADLSVGQWSTLFTQLTQDLSNLALINADYTTGLVFNNTLSSFIGNGTASVLVCLDVDNILPDSSFQGKGIFSQANLLTYNVYSDTTDVNKMNQDQLSKLENYQKDTTGQVIDQLHLVSWTLTPSSLTDPTIQELAGKASIPLSQNLLWACTQSAFPNVILVDWVENTNTTALAMAINKKVYGNVSPNPPAPTQRYVSALTVQASNDSSFFPPGTCVDESGDLGSPDCNNSFGGEYTYVVKSFTTDPSQAVTGLSIEITGDSDPALGGDLAKGAGGDFRYVVTSQDLKLPTRISEVQLWRSPNDSVSLADAINAGWDGISTDINHGRSGAYLYLVWKDVQA